MTLLGFNTGNCQSPDEHVKPFILCVLEQHFRSLEERRRSEKEGGSHLSDTLPRKKPAPAMNPQFSCATLGRSFQTKVHTPERLYMHEWHRRLLSYHFPFTVLDAFSYRTSFLLFSSPTHPWCKAPVVAAFFPGCSRYPARKPNLDVCRKVRDTSRK